MANDVVVREGETDPAVGRGLFGRGDAALEVPRIENAAEIIERVGHMQAVVARGVLRHHLELVLGVPDLPNGGLGGILVEHGPQPLEELQIFRPALVIDVFLEIIGVHGGCGGGVEVLGLHRRVRL
jgi:hypothetical protein